MITTTERKKIDISKVKEAHISGIVGDLISEQSSEMDIEEFLNNVKVWENLLKRKVD